MNKARDMAGPSRVCKTFRERFDSAPRLQDFWPQQFWFFCGKRFGFFIMRQAEEHPGYRSFWAGVVYPIATAAARAQNTGETLVKYRKKMCDAFSERDSAKLALDQLRQKHIEISKQLSSLKRKRGKADKQTS